jgi:hypothetical protein
MEKYSKIEVNDLINATLYAVAKLSRHKYWNRMLWLKLGEWDENDKPDVQNAFVLKCIYEETHIPISPVGMSWGYISSEELAKKYFERYDRIWKDYIEWCNEQR